MNLKDALLSPKSSPNSHRRLQNLKYDSERADTLDIDSNIRRVNNSTARLLLQRHTN